MKEHGSTPDAEKYRDSQGKRFGRAAEWMEQDSKRCASHARPGGCCVVVFVGQAGGLHLWVCSFPTQLPGRLRLPTSRWPVPLSSHQTTITGARIQDNEARATQQSHSGWVRTTR